MRVKCATIPAGAPGRAAPARSSAGWRSSRWPHLPSAGRDVRGSGIRQARGQGTRRSRGMRPVPHPDRVAQHVPGCRAGPRGPPPHGRRGRPLPRAPGIPRIRRTVRAAGRLARPHGRLSPVSGRRSRITSMSWTPSTCRAAADSAVRTRRDGLRIGSRMRCLAVGDRDQAQPGPRRGQHGHRAAHAEDLVVGVSGDDHDARPAQRVSGRKMLQPGPGVASLPRRSRAGRCGSARPGCALIYHAGPLPATSAPSSARSRSA